MGFLEKALLETTPALALVVGLVFVVYRLGTLWITKHFDKMVPVYERGVKAIENLAETAEKMSADILKEQRALGTGVRAAWAEIEEIRQQEDAT